MTNSTLSLLKGLTAEENNKAVNRNLTQPASNTLSVMEKIIAQTCTCKLRTICLDKNADSCLKNKNIYAQEMQKTQIRQ